MPFLLLQPLPRILILVAIFLLAVIAALLAGGLASNRIEVRRRLAEHAPVASLTAEASLRGSSTRGAWRRIADAIEARGLSLADTNSSLQSRLMLAGYVSPDAPRIYTLLRLVLTLGLPMLLVVLCLVKGQWPSLPKLYLSGMGLALMGLYGPHLWLSAKASRRAEAILHGFPDALDLMLVCVEAGMGVEAAFDRVGRELSISQPLVAELLAGLVLELRAGRSREDALRRMADRARVDEIRSFATLLIQSDKFGSSIGQTLRVYASEMREKRRMRAEEKAHRLPVLLSVPLVACLLPVMIGVLMLPAAIRVVRDLVPMMTR